MSINEIYECTFNWTIENFSHCFKKNGEFILSPIFSTDCYGGSKWQMKLYPRGNMEDRKESISLFLSVCEHQMDVNEIFINQMWQLIVQGTQILYTRSCTNECYKNNVFRGYGEFYEVKEIYDKIKECGEDKLTIKCHISRIEPKLCYAITRICVDQHSFRWNIIKPNSSNWLESKKISLQVSLQLQIDITAPEDDILITITFDTSYSASLYIKGTVSLLNAKGHQIETQIGDYLCDCSISANIWQFPSFIKKSQLENEKDNIFKDGSFTLDWKFSYSKDMDSYVYYAVSTLKDDLGEMLKRKKHSDVQLKCENVILSAHKSILSVRSPFFSAMFDENMIENKSGIVDIVDCDSSTLKLFLEYLYNDALKISDSETALKLLLVAEKYQVLNLKQLCCSFLLTNLTVENVCEILVAADMIGHKHLKSTALNLIKTNQKDVFSSSERREWIVNHPNLAVEILSL